MECKLCPSFGIHIHDITALRTRLFHAAALDIARIDNGGPLMQHTPFMDMAQRPVIKSTVQQILAATRRIRLML
ncbi:hypothetical protein D3C73_1259640 [compost metagenome]